MKRRTTSPPLALARLTLATLLVTTALFSGALAQERALDPEVFEIGRLLRCPTCVSESVAESSSAIAREMRLLIQEQLDAGADREEVLAFFQERYGDWILQQPPFRGLTLVLWIAPVLALVAGALLLVRVVRRWRSHEQETPEALAEGDRARLQAAMATASTDHGPTDHPDGERTDG